MRGGAAGGAGGSFGGNESERPVAFLCLKFSSNTS
jgi:hypothetical protein